MRGTGTVQARWPSPNGAQVQAAARAFWRGAEAPPVHPLEGHALLLDAAALPPLTTEAIAADRLPQRSPLPRTARGRRDLVFIVAVTIGLAGLAVVVGIAHALSTAPAAVVEVRR